MRIGIFDSGLGGLTAVRELELRRPDAGYVYFGDTARVPYGGRSKEVLDRYAVQDSRFLISKKVDAIMVACCTHPPETGKSPYSAPPRPSKAAPLSAV